MIHRHDPEQRQVILHGLQHAAVARQGARMGLIPDNRSGFRFGHPAFDLGLKTLPKYLQGDMVFRKRTDNGEMQGILRSP